MLWLVTETRLIASEYEVSAVTGEQAVKKLENDRDKFEAVREKEISSNITDVVQMDEADSIRPKSCRWCIHLVDVTSDMTPHMSGMDSYGMYCEFHFLLKPCDTYKDIRQEQVGDKEA